VPTDRRIGEIQGRRLTVLASEQVWQFAGEERVDDGGSLGVFVAVLSDVVGEHGFLIAGARQQVFGRGQQPACRFGVEGAGVGFEEYRVLDPGTKLARP
jgi:hypothetical protein